MSTQNQTFKETYGPWAVIAGASEGLGAAFANTLAEKGLNLVLIARRPDPLKSLASDLTARYGIAVRIIQQDLSHPEMLAKISEETQDIEVGLLVFNTAYMYIGPFLDDTIDNQLKHVDVNCRGPLILSHHFGKIMVERKKGGIILMTSLSGFQGAPWLAAYGATKAFNLVLAEGLWYEFKDRGVDVLACCAGATTTPNYIQSSPKDLGWFAPKPTTPETVAREAVAALGKKHLVIPGRAFRFGHYFMMLLSRKKVISIMGDSTFKMYGDRKLAINK